MHIQARARTHVSTYAHTRTLAQTYVNASVNISKFTHASIHTHANTHARTHPECIQSVFRFLNVLNAFLCIVFHLRNEFNFSGVHGAMNRSGSRAK